MALSPAAERRVPIWVVPLVAAWTAWLAAATACRSPRAPAAFAPVAPAARALHEAATEAVRAGRLEDAVAQLRDALRLEPRYLEAHFAYQEAMLALGRYDRVREEYRLRLVERGGAIEWMLLGRLESHPTLAEFRFRRALAIDPDLDIARHELASLLHRRGDDALALVQQERVMAARPEFAAGRLLLADLLRDQGRYVAAVVEYERYLDQRPRDRYARECIAGCLLRARRLEEAEAAFRELHREDPENADPILGLGSVAMLREEGETAHRLLVRARDIAPDRPETHFNLGLVLEELLGRPREAVASYRRFLELGGAPRLPATIRIRRLERRLGEAR